jgi:hypothetical protein
MWREHEFIENKRSEEEHLPELMEYLKVLTGLEGISRK